MDWCLTGLAGVGKSAAMQALERLMPSPQDLRGDECHPRLTQRLFARLTTHVRTTPTEALRMLGNPTALKEASARTTVAVLTEHVAGWFLRTGVATLAVDELQFITQSDDANTLAAKYLLTLTQLNVPLTYIANFSLGWRLRERPQEEHQRLLPSPIVLEPEPADSQGWRAVVEAYTTAAPGAFSPECMAAAGELHRLTAGLNRVLRQLLVHALGIAHARRDRRMVTIDDVRDAYRGPDFAINREDVEALATMPRSSRATRHRRDLVCPFPSVTPAGRSVSLPRATTDRDLRLADAAIEASLTVAERRRAQEIERSLAQQPGRTDRVRPLRAATPSLLDRLREGDAAAQDLLARSGKRRET